MTSTRQCEANRRNAELSTGPKTKAGKARSRRNAIRHGLTAETVIPALEDADDYAAFELAVTSDYDARTAVERELVLRLASLLWRLRRATAIESGLFTIQALHLRQFRQVPRAYDGLINNSRGSGIVEGAGRLEENNPKQAESLTASSSNSRPQPNELTQSFVRFSNLPSFPLERLSRYEAALWRQACQLILVLGNKTQRR
jgi:hypothetical protein